MNDKFAEAREEITDAMESKDTVYFNEEAEVAQEVANEAIALYEALLERMSKEQADGLRRTTGLKMGQLKAELDLLLHDDEH